MMPTEFLSGLIGFLLTLLVFSYLFGDTILFRFAVHLFVGVAAGYVAVVTLDEVIWPYLILPLVQAPLVERGLLIVPLLLGTLLLMRLSPRLAWLGRPAVAYLVGAGAAVAIVGAVQGTLAPQLLAAAEAFDLATLTGRGIHPLEVLFNGTVMLIGTIATLAYFHFGARRQPGGSIRRHRVIELIAWPGKIFLALTLGVLFAGVYLAALTALVERTRALLSFVFSLFGL